MPGFECSKLTGFLQSTYDNILTCILFNKIIFIFIVIDGLMVELFDGYLSPQFVKNVIVAEAQSSTAQPSNH